MSSALSLSNLAVWAVQVLMITSLGALLPLVFRIDHPRSNLVYYRFLLIAALLLPLFQPLQHEIVTVPAADVSAAVSTTASPTVPLLPSSATVSWRNIILALLAGGIVIRLVWVSGGLLQLRRLRSSSSLLMPLPAAVQNALRITRTSARFCISESIKGPVTFGFLNPVVLLPKSFSQMPDGAQSSVACHELLHVRRRDWLWTMCEELLASLLWFQPAVWWLIARSQLAREQVVDAEVVSLAASRESYLETLFSLAEAKWEVDLGVASLFLRRRHLIHRVHSLLAEVSMSRMRLVSSYCAIAVVLALGGATMFAALPLTGAAEIRQAAQVQPVATTQSNIGFVVNRPPLTYPVEALQKRIEGQVVVELTFNAQGEIVDSRVISGPEPLRLAGLQTALGGKYPIDNARSLQVLVDFKLPASGQRGPGVAPAGGPRGGARGAAPGAPVTPGGVLDQARGLSSGTPQRVRVGGRIAQNNLISQVPPVYSKEAQDAKVQGTVVLEADISKEGRVTGLRVVSGHPLLISSAMDAVKNWIYKPTLLNGQPVDIVTSITLDIPSPN